MRKDLLIGCSTIYNNELFIYYGRNSLSIILQVYCGLRDNKYNEITINYRYAT